MGNRQFRPYIPVLIDFLIQTKFNLNPFRIDLSEIRTGWSRTEEDRNGAATTSNKDIRPFFCKIVNRQT